MITAMEIAGVAIDLLAVLVSIITGSASPGTPPSVAAPSGQERTLGPAPDALRAPEVVEP